MPKIGGTQYASGGLSFKDSKFQLPGRPNLLFDLETDEVDKLMKRVCMDNTFLRFSTTDIELISNMKDTIEHQI